ncbi:hypothetical protein H9L41_13940 [Chitinimonas koreensis]|nr:hypothetical protein H9L41_13940 [Chitinimonas koreensis]
MALPEPAAREDSADELLAAHPDADGQVAAVVVAASPRKVVALTRDGDTVEIAEPGLRFAAAGLREGAPAKLRIRPGAVVRIGRDARGAREIVQLPQIQGALVALAPQDGAIRALVGGFDFGVNKFNRAAQAWRQPGSTFKPFVYSAALERGVGPATIVNDAAFSVQLDPGSDKRWEPKNDDGSEAGPISMRSGLQKSKNLVAVRVADYVGVPFIRDYVQRFGFVPAQVPPYLPMALGAGQVTPLQLAGAYAVFANGGWRVPPYLIAEVRDGRGQLLLQARPAVAEANAIRALTPRNAFVMHQLLLGVAQRGTAWQSNALGRTDIGGKTGTTNDMHDVWFAGYQHSLLAVSWLGYDQPRSVGAGGAQLALPMWMRFMGRALKGVPTYQMPQPPGVLQIGGEWYLDLFTPGNGFVSAIGMDGVEMPAPDELTDEDMSGDEPEETEAEAGDSTYVEPPAAERNPPMDEATPPPSTP